MKLRHIFASLALSLTAIGSASAATIMLDEPGRGFTSSAMADAPLGNGAWSANTFGEPESYSQQYILWESSAADADYRLGDLMSLSFETLKPSGDNDFFIQIYTFKDGTNDGASWYGQRITFDPLYAKNKNAPADTWNTWSTAEGENQLAIYDHQNYGGYEAPTFAELMDENYSDDEYYTFPGVNYASEIIKGIVVKTGSGWANTFEGSIDNINLEFTGNRSLQIDLEPASVPAPSTFVLFVLALGGLAARRINRA